jgi:AbrB family looped-hinge helix DNA binding protein
MLGEEQGMSEFLATVSSKHQVTLPAVVRRHLGIKAADKISFVVDADGVHLKPACNRVANLYASIPVSRERALDLDRAIEMARDERAHEIVIRMRPT